MTVVERQRRDVLVAAKRVKRWWRGAAWMRGRRAAIFGSIGGCTRENVDVVYLESKVILRCAAVNVWIVCEIRTKVWQ